MAGQDKAAPVGGRQMHIDHLQGRHFFQHGPWCQSRGQRAQPVLERDLQAIGHEGDEDVRLDAVLVLVVNWPDRQVAFEFLEGLLDFGELDVIAPQHRRVVAFEVGSQQVSAFPPPDKAQFPPVQGKAEGLRGDGLVFAWQLDIDEAVGPAALPLS